MSPIDENAGRRAHQCLQVHGNTGGALADLGDDLGDDALRLLLDLIEDLLG
ncbi:hypothetical protein [Pseudonocardia adelaidensis]|uniref:Uncharacterized protein n=1 Tax=Pseudonocardia adelaidensis TaxID=648754 RepID=A0ABP9N9X2_9PSEU